MSPHVTATEPVTYRRSVEEDDGMDDDTDENYESTTDRTPQTSSTMPTIYDMDTDQDEINNDGAMNDVCSTTRESARQKILPSDHRPVRPDESADLHQAEMTRSHNAVLSNAMNIAPFGPTSTIGSSESDCYITVLSRTAKLEQAIVNAPRRPVSMDILLEAERDLQTLTHWSFQCRNKSGVAADEPRHSSSRLIDRPLPLSIALLAETIVGMLEEAFRFAADTAASMTTTPGIPELYGNSQLNAMSRRLERSFRGFLDLPCVFPMPTGDFDIRIGEYVVDGPAKARAVKRILQRRTRRLIQVLNKLGELLSYPRTGSPQSSRPLNSECASFSGLLDWGGSTRLMNENALQLARDLVRRLEAVQGGLALTG